MHKSVASLLVALSPFAALAATPQTTTLHVQNMTGEVSPITVKQSLGRLPCVSQIRIDFAQKTATVTFDADQAQVPTLVKATTDAGYPSTLRK